MIDARFSAEAFAALGPNTPAADELCEVLRGEIASEIRNAAEVAFGRVVEQLRAMGHDLHEMESDSRTYFCPSFGPSEPYPADGWLVVSFEIMAIALYASEKTEPARTTTEQDGSEGVPF